MPALPKDGAQAATGFDFTGHMRRFCRTLVADLPELAHIDLERVAIGFRQTRRRGTAGVQATLTPLRFAGRCYAHSHSRDGYDREMAVLAKRWLAGNPSPETYAFLRLELTELRRTHGPIRGLRYPTPKLRVITDPENCSRPQ